MKKLVSFFVCIINLFACLLIFAGCKNTEEESKLSSYEMKLVLVDNKLWGSEKVSYVNSSENAFDKLYFHLYPNAFRQGAKSRICSSAKWDDVYYKGQSYGQISILSVSFAGEKQAEFFVGGEDENILTVCLQEDLFPDEEVEINIDFEVVLPEINHRFGIGQNTINIANFYPVACVYEDGVGFSMKSYHSNGDPFYSECADFMVQFSYPQNLTLASSGMIVEETETNLVKTATIKGDNIRDFALTLSDKFETKIKEVDGVKVCYYGYQGDQDLDYNLDTAARALETFNRLFGQYPYQTLSVVKASFLHGGMEFPNIVLIADNLAEEDVCYVIAHEIAHQWWYGVVGNDQYNYAWLDEALAEYSTLLFFEENPSFGLEYKSLVASAQKSYNSFVGAYRKVFGDIDTSMNRSLENFNTEPEYVQCTYTKGVLMMDFLRNSIGKAKLVKGLKNYYQNYSFKVAKPEDFISTITKVGGGKMENAIKVWLEGKDI